MRLIAGISVLMLVLVSCSREPVLPPVTADSPYPLQIPAGFPAMPVPDDNALTIARVELGKRLFFDKRLSRDFSLSCASCHLPERAFTEDLPLSIGVNGAVGLRNSPTLANVGYLNALFAEGGIPSLELQALAPIIEPHEMDMGFETLIERLKGDEAYVNLFQFAYHTEPDVLPIVKALSSFQRTLISGNSRFDQFYYQGKQNVLNESELRGMDLFFSDTTSCSSCHTAPLFTNQAFENIGLYEEYADKGRGRLTLNPEDDGKFRVPTLRNIELSAPYMHNGSIATLDEVVEHFNQGGVGHANQNELVRPLNLSEQDKTDLVNFLKSLTDHSFVTNPAFK